MERASFEVLRRFVPVAWLVGMVYGIILGALVQLKGNVVSLWAVAACAVVGALVYGINAGRGGAAKNYGSWRTTKAGQLAALGFFAFASLPLCWILWGNDLLFLVIFGMSFDTLVNATPNVPVPGSDSIDSSTFRAFDQWQRVCYILFLMFVPSLFAFHAMNPNRFNGWEILVWIFLLSVSSVYAPLAYCCYALYRQIVLNAVGRQVTKWRAETS